MYNVRTTLEEIRYKKNKTFPSNPTLPRSKHISGSSITPEQRLRCLSNAAVELTNKTYLCLQWLKWFCCLQLISHGNFNNVWAHVVDWNRDVILQFLSIEINRKYGLDHKLKLESIQKNPSVPGEEVQRISCRYSQGELEKTSCMNAKC